MNDKTGKNKGILFSAPMVRALLDGTKTQTRRTVKVTPDQCEDIGIFYAEHPCPYGQPGDRLYVRETWLQDSDGIHYRADETFPEGAAAMLGGWRPSIHMPRKASRITLEVTGVRVERLNDISEADAIAEGITCENVIVGCNCNGGVHREEFADRYFFDGGFCDGYEYAEDAYRALWEKINGPGSWDLNPWVWVIEFRRMAA